MRFRVGRGEGCGWGQGEMKGEVEGREGEGCSWGQGGVKGAVGDREGRRVRLRVRKDEG